MATRPAQSVADEAPIEVISDGPEYVSRGALKLQKALDVWAIDPRGKVALDVGASAHESGQLRTPTDFVDLRLPALARELFCGVRGFRRWAVLVHKIVE